MNSLYYLAMLIGIGWLAVWSILPPQQHGKGWWPFDMRDDMPAPGRAAGEAQRRHSAAWQQGKAQGPDTAVPPDPTGAPSSPHSRQPASWRTRRETGITSRRKA